MQARARVVSARSAPHTVASGSTASCSSGVGGGRLPCSSEVPRVLSPHHRFTSSGMAAARAGVWLRRLVGRLVVAATATCRARGVCIEVGARKIEMPCTLDRTRRRWAPCTACGRELCSRACRAAPKDLGTPTPCAPPRARRQQAWGRQGGAELRGLVGAPCRDVGVDRQAASCVISSVVKLQAQRGLGF